MSKLLYMLEDHFEAVAEERQGQVSGWISNLLGGVFAFAGDVARGIFPRNHRFN